MNYSYSREYQQPAETLEEYKLKMLQKLEICREISDDPSVK